MIVTFFLICISYVLSSYFSIVIVSDFFISYDSRVLRFADILVLVIA